MNDPIKNRLSRNLMNNLFEDYMSARCTVKVLKRTIEELKSGEI